MTGQQQPRIRIEPARTDTDGTGAGMLMQEYGVQLDPWQQLVLDAWLGTDASGKYTATTCALSVSRQNGKNVCIEAFELYTLLINGGKVLHSAHQVRTTRKSFRRLAAMFSDRRHPEILEQVRQIRQGVGEESIELRNGGSIEFISRSRGTGRGYDGISAVIVDEAQEATEDQMEALMAVLSASTTGTRQLIFCGTAPYPGCPGTVFQRLRQSCILSADKEGQHNCWHEWSPDAESLQDIDISNRDLWAACNPAYNIRLTPEFTAEEMKTLSPDGFARERLNFWAKPAETVTEVAIDPAAWEACKSTEEKPEGKTAYGIKFAPDGSEVVLAGAIIPTEGKARITLLAMEPTGRGISWLAQWLNERYKTASCVVIDGRNGADVLIEKIRPAGGGTWAFKDSVIKAGARDVIAAASGLINDLNEGAVTWYAEQDELNDSALSVTKRTISGGWGFGGQASAPIEACALALYGCRTSKRNPQKSMKIG